MYFTKYPEIKWEWTYDFRELSQRAKPNAGHTAIHELAKHWKENGVKVSIVTQNIDSIHRRIIEAEEAKTNSSLGIDLFEIHGNLEFMRWYNECHPAVYPTPDRPKESEDVIPKCPNCGEMMRPHILWFDESYNEEYYKLNSVKKIIGMETRDDETQASDCEDEYIKADALIVGK